MRIINLETSITSSEDAWPGKGIHYRIHTRNFGCLTAAGIDCCCLANYHTLDWGYAGLTETLRTLDRAGFARAGAGENAAEASAPATLDVPGKGRVLVCSMGSTTSGISREWGATRDRPGVNVLEDLSDETTRPVAGQIRAVKRPGDVTVASIHWGGNWGYHVPAEQIRFAHRLVEDGVDVVHGHSSHHPKAIEIYRDHPIFYGCGDFLDDYEGISGHEEFRGDLRLMYMVRVDPQPGRLVGTRLVVLQARRFRLSHASAADTKWLGDLLDRLGARCGTLVQVEDDGRMTLPGSSAHRAARLAVMTPHTNSFDFNGTERSTISALPKRAVE